MSAAQPLGPDRRVRQGRRAIAGNPVVLLSCGLAALLVVTDLVNRAETGGEAFLSPSRLSTTFLYAAILGLLSAGQTLVMLTGGIDLSVATTATAAAFVVSSIGIHGSGPAILAALGLGLGIGLVNGGGVSILHVNPLLMTLGVSTITLAGLPIYSEAHPGTIVPDAIQAVGSRHFAGYVPYDLLVWVPIAVLIVVGLRSTAVGRLIYAARGDTAEARPGGARVRLVQLLVYAVSGLLSAAAGVLLVGLNNAADLGIASQLLLPSIAAVMIGGTSIFGGVGGYVGTIFGALLMTVLDSLLTILGAGQAGRQIVYASIILVLAAMFARTRLER